MYKILYNDFLRLKILSLLSSVLYPPPCDRKSPLKSPILILFLAGALKRCLMSTVESCFHHMGKNPPHLSFRSRVSWSRPGGVGQPVFSVQFTNTTLDLRFLLGACLPANLIFNLLLHTQASSQLK